MKDLRQTLEYARFMSSLGWMVERKSGVNYFIRKFPLIGSFIKIQRPNSLVFPYIERLTHKYKAFQVVVEPKSSYYPFIFRLKSKGFRQSSNPFLPSKTLIIDLTKSERQLLSEMHYKTRYNIKKSLQNSRLKIQISDNIQQFAKFWQSCALRQRGMFLQQKHEIIKLHEAFGKKAHIILCLERYSQELLSGILLLQAKSTAYYMYAAASKFGKKLFAPTLNTWEAIRLAKRLGCKFFDFEGIYDERFPLNSWKGFTRFKKSFGGKEIEYPGAFVKYYNPLKYLMLRNCKN